MKFISSPTDLKKPLKWLALALCIKVILYVAFILPDKNPGRKYVSCFIKSADHSEYIRPIDNLIENGSYRMDNVTEPYAGRLPGFVFPYVLFRAIANENTAGIMLGIFILLLSVLASYTLALLLFDLTQKRWAFISGFFLINFAPYFWHYDWTIHTSSLGISSLIFFCYFYNNYLKSKSNKQLFYAGFFIAWLFFLRGFCFVFVPIALFHLLVVESKSGTKIKGLFIKATIFSLAFVIIEGAWVIRNYITLKQFIPLQTSVDLTANSKNPEYSSGSVIKYSTMKLRELIFAWGGDNCWYFKDSEMGWFLRSPKTDSVNFKFDQSVFCEGITMDSLRLIRTELALTIALNADKAKQDSLEIKIANSAIRLREKFVSEKPFYYYFYSPLKRTKNLLFQNVTQDWPGVKTGALFYLQKIVKLFSILCYGLLLLQLIIFPFVIRKRSNKKILQSPYVLFYLIALTNILMFTFLVPMAHYTYFIFGYTMLIPIFVYNLNAFLSKDKE